jgi:hypothetical protein
MRHIERLPKQFSIQINPDEEGYMGRECPEESCLGYFKVTPGTGVIGDPHCYCPYCGHQAEHDKFFTQEQLEYAKSIILNQVTNALLKDLKSLEFNHKPRGSFGIGISMQVKGSPQPIHHYREKQLETEIVCDRCTLRYAIYGVFAYCSDCGAHNSRQILDKNIELAEKEVTLAATSTAELSDHLIADALENIVAAFDGFGREICRVHARLAAIPARAENISFQNLLRSKERVEELFGIDLSASVGASDWSFAHQCFQKRHLLAHRMGIVDESYLQATNDPSATVGRKIRIGRDEVTGLAQVVRMLGDHLAQGFETLKVATP